MLRCWNSHKGGEIVISETVNVSLLYSELVKAGMKEGMTVLGRFSEELK